MSIVIARRKTLFYRNIVLSGIATAVILWTFLDRLKVVNDLGFFEFFLIGILVFNFYIVVNSIKHALRKTPALLLSDEGITDNVSLLVVGLIVWDDIADCELKKYNGSQHLLIKLTENHKPFDLNGQYKENIAKSILKSTGAHIAINCEIIEYNRLILQETILKRIGRVNIDHHFISQ